MPTERERVGGLVGRCLRSIGATRAFATPSSGFDRLPGLDVVVVDDQELAALLADAQGRISSGAGVALLPDRRLRISSQPGMVCDPTVIDDPGLLPGAIAGWSLGGVYNAVELILDLDLDAPAPDDIEPILFEPAGPLTTLSPTLADFRMLVLAGPGVVRANQVAALRDFAARAGVGVVNTWGAKGLFAWNSPHHYGTAGLQARDFDLAGFPEAELIVAVGIDPDESPAHRWSHGQVLEVEPFQLAALAYHWPDPDPVAPYPVLYTALAEALGPLYASDASPLAPARAAADLAAARPAGGLVAADPGPAGLWVARTFPTTEVGSVAVPSRQVRGFATAAALVAALDGRAAIAVTTAPVDPVSDALVDLAAGFEATFVLAEWGADAAWTSAGHHAELLTEALAAPGVSRLGVPVDFSLTRVLVEVAGEVVAWSPG